MRTCSSSERTGGVAWNQHVGGKDHFFKSVILMNELFPVTEEMELNELTPEEWQSLLIMGFTLGEPLHMFLCPQHVGSRKLQLPQGKKKYIYPQSNQILTWSTLKPDTFREGEERTFIPFYLIGFFPSELIGPIVSRLSTVIPLIETKRKRGSSWSSSIFRIWKGKEQLRTDY